MNVFARPTIVPSISVAQAKRIFLFLFLIGAVLRCYASFNTFAMIHPDEHQQFLEQAQKLVYGYAHHFWEQERGIRHALYPALLAIPLGVLEFVGIRDPITQGILLRWFVSLAALFACTLFAWEFQRRGDSRSAFLLMALYSLMPDIIYTQIHPLSETAATVPFLLALVLMERRPFWSGVLLGLSFGIRFQMGFIIGTTVILVWLRNRGRFDANFLRLSTGFALTMIGLGLCDRIQHGAWFHSPIEYVRANLVEGVANQWGVEPWYQYVLWLAHGGWAIIIPLAVLVSLGARREWPLLILALGFIIPHMIVAHKEARFMLPVAPLMLALVAVGFSELGEYTPARLRRNWWTVGLACIIALGVIRVPQIKWNIQPYRSTCILLHAAGKRPDLTGVAVTMADRTEIGNYFYLRRDVPLYAKFEPWLDDFRGELKKGESLNYLLGRPRDLHRFEELRPVEIMSCDGVKLYFLEVPLVAK